jgi:hypothetical protein
MTRGRGRVERTLLDAPGDLRGLAAGFKFSAADTWAPPEINLDSLVQTLF